MSFAIVLFTLVFGLACVALSSHLNISCPADYVVVLLDCYKYNRDIAENTKIQYMSVYGSDYFKGSVTRSIDYATLLLD